MRNQNQRRRPSLFRLPSVALVLLSLLTLSALVVFPLVGRTCYSPIHYGEFLSASVKSESAPLILEERFWNTLLAMLAGSGLSLAGLILQTLFRNPLASPFTLGIAGGASFGATLWLFLAPFFWGTVGSFGGFGLCAGAFLGAMLAMTIVFCLGRHRDISSEKILLAGIAVNFFFSSLILFVQYLSEEGRSFRMLRWTMGEIDLADPRLILPVAGVVVIGGTLLFLFSREMDLLLTGEERALSLGMNLGAFRIFLFFLSSILVGVVVSVCGPVGFVGLMVPHFCRLLVDRDHRYLVPASLLFGALFLGACWTAARIVFYPDILPVGVVTSLLGGPFFLWLLLRKR